jgi:hypothetical protein
MSQRERAETLLADVFTLVHAEQEDEWKQKIVCAMCSESLAEVDSLDGWFSCSACPPIDDLTLFWCADCADRSRQFHEKRKGKFDHDAAFEKVSAEVKTCLEMKCLKEVAIGLCFGLIRPKGAHGGDLAVVTAHSTVSVGTSALGYAVDLLKAQPPEVQEKALEMFGKFWTTAVVPKLGDKLSGALAMWGRTGGRSSAKKVLEFATGESWKKCAGAVVPLLKFSYDTLQVGWKLCKGELSLLEAAKEIGISAASNTALFAGSYVGKVAGMAVGTAIGGPVLGFIFAAVGSAVLGAGAMMVTKAALSSASADESDECTRKKQLLEEALKMFRLKKSQMDDPSIFNGKKLKKEYRTLCLTWHPDRPAGDTQEFQKVNLCYGLLVAELEKRQAKDIGWAAWLYSMMTYPSVCESDLAAVELPGCDF